jgi:hypothetical protein
MYIKIKLGQRICIFIKNRKDMYLIDLFSIFFTIELPGNCFYLYLLNYYGGGFR